MRKTRTTWAVAAILGGLFLGSASGTVLINEFMAVNKTGLADENGDQSDWIELYNAGTTTVSLAGWYLTDESSDLDKWPVPSFSLLPDEYIVIFASDKDRRNPADEMHTNFKLSGDGEYLALVQTNGYTVEHAYAPEFPEQLDDVSYGISTNLLHEFRYFATPTPGAVNGGEYLGLVGDTKFSVDRGFYSNAFEVAVTSQTVDAEIRYTVDGTTPSPVHGDVYAGSIAVSNTTLLRALAWKPGWRSSDVDTQTYIFLQNVVEQPAVPEGYTDVWKTTTADYEMDPDVVTDSVYGPQMIAALLSLPSVSIVTDRDNLFDATTGIYANSTQQGVQWERPISIEWIRADGQREFQENAGLRIYGGAFRGMAHTRKKSFRVLFKSDYGASKLSFPLFDSSKAVKSFDTFIMRAGANDAWNNWSAGVNAQYITDEFVRATQRAMGREAGHGRFIHLYLNGLYWGLYNLVERADTSFCESYFGGDKDEWDALNSGAPTGESNTGTWSALLAQVRAGLVDNAAYQKLQGNNPDRTPNPVYDDLLDVPNYIDYILDNQWCGTDDWPWKNWYAACRRPPAATGFKCFSWDAEMALGLGWSTLTEDRTEEVRGIAEPYGELRKNAEFRLLFGDHVHRHCFNGGVLTQAAAQYRYRAITDEVELAVIAESARWGDQHGGSPRTQANWLARRDWVLDTCIPTKVTLIPSQWKGDDLYPSIAAPVFSRHGGAITNSYALSMSASATIHYTTDGTDPREYGTGTPVGTSYGSAVTLTETTLVRARAFDGADWSALNEAVFTLATPPALKVTELMYNPRDAEGAETNVTSNADAFEFLELRNTGPDTVGLAGLNFSEGIDFDFTEMDDLFLDPGERLLLVRDLDAFAARYDTSGLRIAGEYDGALDNAGERITLVDGIGSNVISLAYDDARGWPQAADGAGHSLVPLAADGLSYGGNWRASAFIDGSPGLADPTPVHDVVLNEFAAHTDYTNAAKPEYDSNDWLELFNTRTNAISLSNFYLSDDPGALRKWAIPATNTVAGGGYLSFDEVTGFHSPITSGFGLNKAGEALYLSYLPGTAQDRVVDCLRFKGQENGATLGRYPDGADWWYTTVPTRSTTNALAAEHVVINQLMTHPADGTNEYIVLYNPSATPAELWNAVGPYRIDGGVSYDFPSNTMIAARDYATLVPFSPTNSAAVAAFETAYGLPAGQTYLLGPFDGKLDNVGDRVALERPQAPDAEGEGVSWVIVDEVIYSGYSPWPTNVHANGNALQRIDGRHSGNDPSNWVGQPAGLVPAKIFITYPWAGSTLDMPFDVEVVATVDPNQVSGSVQRVDFFLDDVLLGTDATIPYSAAMNYTHVSNTTSYTLRADLVDGAGTNRSVEIVFHADHADRVHLVDPLDGLSLVAPFTQLVRAGVDMDHVLGTIDNVSFYSGTNLLYTDPTAPYEFLASDLDLPPTRWHDLTATVLDDFGPTTSRVVSLYSYDSVWSNATYRMKVHFPGYLGDERVQEFPALVTLSEGIPGFSYSQVASPTGADLRFADHTGTNIVVHEIESWDTNGNSTVWVRLPELTDTNTWIWAYWGDPNATLPAYATDGSVWSEDYELVLHMADSSGGFAGDSSSNAYTAAFQVWVSYTWNESGAVGRAVRFGDNFACLELSPDVPMGAEWTLSSWFKDLAGTGANRILAETALGDSPAIVPAGGNALGSEQGGAAPCGYGLTASSAWRQLTVVGDADGTRYYVDAQPVGSISNRVGGSLASIGNMSSGFGTERFARYLDEVRFSSTVRSEDWIAASWLNQASNGVFVTFGPAERQEPSGEPEPDSDGNGMLDTWEEKHFGGTGVDPDGDPDRDGMRTLEEFIAGTDPTNALSLFDVSMQWSAGQLLVVFETEDASPYGPGYQRYYSLESNTNLLVPSWQGVGAYTNIPGAGQSVIYTNPAEAPPQALRGSVWMAP